MKEKRGSLVNSYVIQIVLVALILIMFLLVTAEKINGRGVHQQVLEKELALLIDSAEPGMRFEVSKINLDGTIQEIRVENGKIHVEVEGLPSIEGYPYFTKYIVEVEETPIKFLVKIK